VKNGRLLDAAENAGFDVLVTGDRTLQYEQNMRDRKIALVSLSAVGWPVIERHVGKIVDAVNGANPGTIARVDCGTFTRRRPKPDRS
jgi:hypothetical protein